MFVEIHDHLAAQAKLADRYAEIKAEIEGLKLLLEEVKEDIIKTGRDNIVGARNIVTVTLSEPVRFDATAAKAFLTADQIAACTKVGDLVTTIRVKAVKNAKVLA
jgi:hypothetical protein